MIPKGATVKFIAMTLASQPTPPMPGGAFVSLLIGIGLVCFFIWAVNKGKEDKKLMDWASNHPTKPDPLKRPRSGNRMRVHSMLMRRHRDMTGESAKSVVLIAFNHAVDCMSEEDAADIVAGNKPLSILDEKVRVSSIIEYR